MASKQRKGEDGQAEPTNAEIMRAVNGIAGKLDDLASKKDLDRVERDLHAKLHEKARETGQQIRTSNRMIAETKLEISQNKSAIERLEERMNRQERNTSSSQTGAVKRQEAQKAAYMRARRSVRIWPIEKRVRESNEAVIRRFFVEKMKVPDEVADSVSLDTMRKAAHQPARSKVRNEYIITFAEREERDAIKSRELAAFRGEAGLRLEVPEHLKGHLKILEEHAYAMIDLYGREVKRNIKFDDRCDDLMIDIKLPHSPKWHNITMKQAIEAKKVREEHDIQAIRAAGPKQRDGDKSKALLLVTSPGSSSRTGAPMSGLRKGLSILNAFKAKNRSGEEDPEDEEEVEEILRTDQQNKS